MCRKSVGNVTLARKSKNIRLYIDGPLRDALRSGSYFTLQCSLQSSTPKCPGQSFCANHMDTEVF